MPRLFTGLEIPADVGQRLPLLRGGLPGARWIDPENYHITLRFIGDVDDRAGARDRLAARTGAAARLRVALRRTDVVRRAQAARRRCGGRADAGR